MTVTFIPTATHYAYFTNVRGMYLKHLTLSGVSMSWIDRCYFQPEDAQRLVESRCTHLKLNYAEV